AEDGIRDFHVTGVQTCALPISTVSVQRAILEGLIAMLLDSASIFMFFPVRYHDDGDSEAYDQDYEKRLWEETGRHFSRLLAHARSEERRVGKEYRSQWAQDDEQ